MCPLSAKAGRGNVPTFSVENSQESHKPVEIGGLRGTDQIGVEIQHKDRLLADQGAIEDVLAVENDVVPFDRADVLEQGRVDAFLCDSLRGTVCVICLACQ